MKISVIGLGKLGFPMAKFLKKFNFEVSAYDINQKLCEELKINDKTYLSSEVGINKYKKKIKIFNSIQECLLNTDITYVTVPTPSLRSGKFSNKLLLNVLDNICTFIKAKSKKQPHIININSTVSPGSFEEELIPFMEKKGLINDIDFSFIYNPYFVALGNVFKNLESPDYILLGYSSNQALSKIKLIYRKIYKKPILKPMSLKEAVLVKLLVNCYITSKISFTNFVKKLTDKNGLTSAEVVLEAIGSDKRIGNHYFKQGGPFSGPCFPRDNLALINFCKSMNLNHLIPKTTNKINISTYSDMFNILKFFKRNKFKKIGFLGISYKPNTDDITESVALKLMQESKKLGMRVFYYDNYVNKNIKSFKRYKNLNTLIKHVEILFISYLDKKNNKINFRKISKTIIWDIFEFTKNKNIKKFSNIYQLKKLLKDK